MTFTPNIPQASDDPSQSQPLILANFQQLNIQYGTSGDHVEWTASSANGKHKKVTWINQSASPPSAGLNELVAYGITQSSITMPYYKRDNIATVFPLAPMKAWALITGTGAAGAQTLTNNWNVTSATQSAFLLTVVLTNAMLGTNYGIFATLTGGGGVALLPYTIVNSTTFTLPFQVTNIPAGYLVNVLVLEP